MDETYVKVAGRWVYLYRTIDQYGQVIGVLASPKRNLTDGRPRVFMPALVHGPYRGAPAYPRVIEELIPAACHIIEQYANNVVEADHSRLKPGSGRCTA